MNTLLDPFHIFGPTVLLAYLVVALLVIAWACIDYYQREDEEGQQLDSPVNPSDKEWADNEENWNWPVPPTELFNQEIRR